MAGLMIWLLKPRMRGAKAASSAGSERTSTAALPSPNREFTMAVRKLRSKT